LNDVYLVLISEFLFILSSHRIYPTETLIQTPGVFSFIWCYNLTHLSRPICILTHLLLPLQGEKTGENGRIFWLNENNH
ncbi:hypothetical protein, partial [Thermotoga sp.]|uniref:hypothetical protein n=1 Tax=Thermotoga sp. TaxID=28240 RepID=UPI0025EE569C